MTGSQDTTSAVCAALQQVGYQRPLCETATFVPKAGLPHTETSLSSSSTGRNSVSRSPAVSSHTLSGPVAIPSHPVQFHPVPSHPINPSHLGNPRALGLTLLQARA